MGLLFCGKEERAFWEIQLVSVRSFFGELLLAPHSGVFLTLFVQLQVIKQKKDHGKPQKI